MTEDAVYFATLAGFVYALDRDSGKEKWRLDMRAKTFPDAHPLNGTFASPILADGKIVVAGGAIEQGIRWFLPKYEGFTGRGFVVALEPQSGRIAWKYDVGPKPERLDPPITIKDAWGEHVFQFGPATSTVWSTPSYHAASRTIFFGTDTNNAPRRPTKDDPRLDTALRLRRDRHRRARRRGEMGDADQPGRRLERQHEGLRPQDRPLPRPVDRRHAQGFHDPVERRRRRCVVGFGCKNGGFYIVRAADGMILAHTPLYTGPPTVPAQSPAR